jgi:type IV fimbrial biogenesis protein FimT
MNAQRPWMGPRRRLDHGMTLVELLAVLSILAILLGIGVPGMNRLVAGTRANGSMMELHALLGFARQNAVMLRRAVTLCGTSNGSACATVWNGKATLVFLDDNLNRSADGNERILATSELTRSGRIHWRASGNRSYLRYRPDGGVSEIGRFVYCPADNDPRQARAVIVAATGRARSASDSNGDGIAEDASGSPLSCVN